MATIEEIIMKLEVIQGGGRKRLWDLHELLRSHDLNVRFTRAKISLFT
jgi:hypothetical protein